MAYLELFECVANHVRRQGANVTLKRGEPINASAIAQAQATSLIPIPNSLADFYAEVGDGFEFEWRSKDRGDRPPFANHNFGKLEDRVLRSFDEVGWKPEWNDEYDFCFTDDPTLAKRTAIKMRKWMPFYAVGNGDLLCLDTAIDPAPVVFNKHDWCDGGTGENGYHLGESLLRFLTDWSQVCFQFPRNLWWPGVFNTAGGGVNWKSAEFREPFRLPDP